MAKKDLTATELGHLAYDAFCERLQVLNGKILPTWRELPVQLQMAWVGAGIAVWRHTKVK